MSNLSSNPNRSRGWGAYPFLPLILLFSGILILGGCSGISLPGGGLSRGESAESQDRDRTPSSPSPFPKTKVFQKSGEMDNLLDAKPIPLPPVKSFSSQLGEDADGGTVNTPKAGPGKSRYRIQILAAGDLDEAQAKKAHFQKLLGGTVDVNFDPPYYKLRWGYFETKGMAEDKILELSELKIQGFVVKQ